MARLPFCVNLDHNVRRRLFRAIFLANTGFAVTTTIGYLMWPRMDEFSPALRDFTRYVLVHGQLATENVIAVWYSSMLLLSVAAFSMAAWMVDNRLRASTLRHGWLGFAAIFTLLSIDEIGSLHERVGLIPLPSGQTLGWAYLLAIPIALIAGLMVAFGALHIRRVPRAFTFIGIGALLYVLNPISEDIERAMNEAAAPLALRIVRTLVEEVVLELMGTLCFATGVCVYVATRSRGLLEWTVSTRTLRLVCWSMITALMLLARATLWIDAALPVGDRGMLQNWFPAAAWMLVATIAITAVPTRRWQGFALAVPAVTASAVLGAGLYLHSVWLASRVSWAVPVVATFAAGLTLEALIDGYLLSFSPRSSRASPTLRRPRPNPS
jgi:hypothetical protein